MNSARINGQITPDTRVLVVGLGKTGLSCARYLAKKGLRIAVTDSRTEPPGLSALREELPDVALFIGGFSDEAFANADLLVVSPGVSLATPQIAVAIQRGLPVIGDVELFAREAAAPIAAITGSNGKSTVTTLLGEMARLGGVKVKVGGNLGEPVLDLLDDQAQLYVIELSSFQLETTNNLQAAASVVLNISEDHMDRYASLAEYRDAKARVFHQSAVCVANLDDAEVIGMACPGTRLGFSLRPSNDDACFNLADEQGEPVLRQGSKVLIHVSEVRLQGMHNLANALAALAMGSVLGLQLDGMLAALRTFSGLPHRTSLVAEQNGVRWIDDSKGTNTGATLAALRGLVNLARANIVLIAGGQSKGADFTEFGKALPGLAKALVLIGEDAGQIEAATPAGLPVVRATSMEDAVQQAGLLAQSGDLVLLSPACASFDMFRNYEHRGDVFFSAVRKWLK